MTDKNFSLLSENCFGAIIYILFHSYTKLSDLNCINWISWLPILQYFQFKLLSFGYCKLILSVIILLYQIGHVEQLYKQVTEQHLIGIIHKCFFLITYIKHTWFWLDLFKDSLFRVTISFQNVVNVIHIPSFRQTYVATFKYFLVVTGLWNFSTQLPLINRNSTFLY